LIFFLHASFYFKAIRTFSLGSKKAFSLFKTSSIMKTILAGKIGKIIYFFVFPPDFWYNFILTPKLYLLGQGVSQNILVWG